TRCTAARSGCRRWRTRAARRGWRCTRPSWGSPTRSRGRRCTGRCRCRTTCRGSSGGCGAGGRAMPIQIKWTDTDPETGQRRFLRVERFAKEWHFSRKLQRRGDWTRGLEPTLAMWEHVLDSLKRRYRRREGVSDEEVEEVERIVGGLRRKQEER